MIAVVMSFASSATREKPVKPGAFCSLGKKSRCPRCIVTWRRAGLAFRRSIIVYIG